MAGSLGYPPDSSFGELNSVFLGIGTRFSESVSTGVWCVPGFGAGFETALDPSKLQKEGENPGKGHFSFLHQTLVCTIWGGAGF